MNTPLTPERILQVGLGFWASKTLLSAVEMEVFTELAKHPEEAKQLAPSDPALAPWVAIARVLLNTDEFMTRE